MHNLTIRRFPFVVSLAFQSPNLKKFCRLPDFFYCLFPAKLFPVTSLLYPFLRLRERHRFDVGLHLSRHSGLGRIHCRRLFCRRGKQGFLQLFKMLQQLPLPGVTPIQFSFQTVHFLPQLPQHPPAPSNLQTIFPGVRR
jgi:hypothetical protein